MEVWKNIFKIAIALIWFGPQVDLDIFMHVNRRCEIYFFILRKRERGRG